MMMMLQLMNAQKGYYIIIPLLTVSTALIIVTMRGAGNMLMESAIRAISIKRGAVTSTYLEAPALKIALTLIRQ